MLSAHLWNKPGVGDVPSLAAMTALSLSHIRGTCQQGVEGLQTQRRPGGAPHDVLQSAIQVSVDLSALGDGIST